MEEKVYLWNEMDVDWQDLNLTWEDVVIITRVKGVMRGSGGMRSYVENNPWDVTKKKLGEKDTKRFVEIVCRVNDLDFKKVYETREINVTVAHIQKTFAERLKIEIEI